MKTSSILIFLLLSSSILSQETGRLLGIITATDSGDSLANVNVSIAGTSLGASSNAKGAYLISNIPAASYTVIFSSMGFKQDTVQNVLIEAGQTKRLDVRLQPTVLNMSSVEIEANRLVTLEPELTSPGEQRLNPRAVPNIPGAYDDLNRVVELLGGALSSGDYTGAYAVRGGSLDQNVVFMDGIIVPNPFRMRLMLGGGFSLVNSSTINSANFYTGHFPGQYGDFLSSVMSINTRQGRRDRFGAGASIDFIQTKVALEGPLPGKKGSWLASMRRSYLDVFARPYAQNQTTLPYMFDFDAKLVYDLTENTRLSYKLLYADEATKMIAQTDQEIEMDESAKLNMHMLALESRLSDRTSTSFRAAFYEETFDYNLFADKSDPYAAAGEFGSRIKSFNAHQALSIKLYDNHHLSQGIDVASQKSRLDLQSNAVNIDFTRRHLPPDMLFNRNTGHIGTYVDYTATWLPQFESTLGMRYDYDELIQKDDVSGKLSLLYRIDPDTKVHAFVGNVFQYPTAMSVFTRDLPLNLNFHPERLDSETAIHYTLGFDRYWGYNISTRLEMYYKTYNRLLLPQDRANYLPDNTGEGYAKGFDLIIEKARGANGIFSGLLSYSFGKSEYRDRNEMVWIPFNYDRRHGFNLLADVTIYRGLGATAAWRYHTGLPFNEITGYIWHVDYQSRFVKSALNDQRYSDYSRFDLRLNYRTTLGASRVLVYLDFLNLFNQRNIYERMYYVLDSDNEDESETRTFKYATIYNMPFIPSLGVSIWY